MHSIDTESDGTASSGPPRTVFTRYVASSLGTWGPIQFELFEYFSISISSRQPFNTRIKRYIISALEDVHRHHKFILLPGILYRNKNKEIQLLLDLPIPSDSNVVRLPLPRSQGYLDYYVSDLFCTDDRVLRAAKKLEKLGIVFIGQLVQMPEGTIGRLPFMDQKILDEIKLTLSKIGLGFSTRIPSWARRQRTALGL
jgi:hypothetical protein